MRVLNVFIKAKAFIIIFILATSLPGIEASAQQLQAGNFVLFGGSGGVSISSNSNIKGGSVGSFNIIKADYSSILSTNLYSGGKVVIADSNIVSGRIASANSKGLRGTILLTGSITVSGNIDVNGNIVIGGGAVSGRVTHPIGTTYSGPVPGGGDVLGAPNLPTHQHYVFSQYCTALLFLIVAL